MTSKTAFSTHAAVTDVKQDGSGVTVTISNGTTYRAPYALVTLPLGVLKAGDVSFSPPLTARKQSAVDQLVSTVIRIQPHVCVLPFQLATGCGVAARSVLVTEVHFNLCLARQNGILQLYQQQYMQGRPITTQLDSNTSKQPSVVTLQA